MLKNFSIVVQYLNLSYILEKAVHQTIRLYGLAAGVYQTEIIIKIDENIIFHTIFDNNQFSKSCHRKEGVTVGGLSLAASYIAQVEPGYH